MLGFPRLLCLMECSTNNSIRSVEENVYFGRDARESLEGPCLLFLSGEMARFTSPVCVLSALAWAEPSAAGANAGPWPLFVLSDRSLCTRGSPCRWCIGNGSCWQQRYFYTFFTLSQILNGSCEIDEILCIRLKLTVSHTASKWRKSEFSPGLSVSDDLSTGCLPQRMCYWLVSSVVWICQGQHPMTRRISAVPRAAAVFLSEGTELSQGGDRESIGLHLGWSVLSLCTCGLPSGLAQWLKRFYISGVEPWGTLNSRKFYQLCSHCFD